MKNMTKKILMMFFLCLILVGVCACGPDTTTKLTLNDDCSGTRNMQMFVSTSNAGEWFTKDIETVNTLVEDNCPTELKYFMEESEEGYTFNFTLDFESLEDYASKMTALTGEEQTILLQTPDTVFSSGIYVSESCYTSDLLKWLPTLLVDNECISSDNSGYVLNNSTATLYYGDTEYTSWTSGKIVIDELDTVSLNGVNILTTIADDKLSRILIVDIPEYSFDKKGEEIQAYLEERVPAGATYELTDGNYNNRLFKISIPTCSTSDMESAMKTFCDSENVHVSMKSEAAEGNYTVAHELHEELDLTAYISDNPNSVYSDYSIFTTDNTVTATMTYDDDSISLRPYTNNRYPEYSMLTTGYVIKYSIDTIVNVAYEPKNATVATDIAADDVITQSIKVAFDQINENDKQLILNTVAATIPENMTVSWSEEEENTLVYSASGTASELNDIFGEILSLFNMKYTKDDLIINPLQEYSFKLKIDIKEMVGKYAQNFPTEYVVNFPGKVEKASSEMIDSDNEIEDNTEGKTYIVTDATNSIEIKAKGKVLNVLGIVILGAVALLVVIIIIIVISTVLKKNKKKESEYSSTSAQTTYEAPQPVCEEVNPEASVDDGISAESASQELTQETEVQNPESAEQLDTEQEKSSDVQALCPNCGNELPLNARFCAKCGTKVE